MQSKTVCFRRWPPVAQRSRDFPELVAPLSCRAANPYIRVKQGQVSAWARGYKMSMDRTPLPAELAGELDDRSREIFRALVESYMDSGDPLGSRSLSRMLPMSSVARLNPQRDERSRRSWV
jgi:hypothetical protein